MESETRPDPGVPVGTDHRPAIRLTPWPRDPGVGHLVVLDHRTAPALDDLRRKLEQAVCAGYHTVRTGALFPRAAEVVDSEGFEVIDTLALLRAVPTDTALRAEGSAQRVRRLQRWRDPAAAEIDLLAFGPIWGNDVRGLRSIRSATPSHRARWVGDSDRRSAAPIGVVFAGIGGADGFVQRLAVHPDHRRFGVADALVRDVLAWMAHRRVEQILVNTSVSNHAALGLYARHGFVRLPDHLVVAELTLRTPGPPPDGGTVAA